MAKPMNPREAEEKAKKKPGGQQHPIRRRRPNTERNPRDQKGRGGSSSRFRA